MELIGYDMEDAMTINKASYQRGFCHGTVIKVERYFTNNFLIFFEELIWLQALKGNHSFEEIPKIQYPQ